MKVNLGEVIQLKRKEKRLTQQQLADFVGVSKAAVSKWESGQSYPDITLLPILAAYFHCTIDDLLSYEPMLSKDEIRRICLSLQTTLQQSTDETAWITIQELIKKYYACAPFLVQIGILILNHSDRLPAQLEPNPIYYTRYAKELFQTIQADTNELAILIEAKTLEAYCALALGKSDEVLTLLGDQITPILPTDHLIISAFQQKKEPLRAIEAAQCSLYQQIMLCLQSGSSLISVASTAEQATQTMERLRVLIETFHIEHLNPALTLNLYVTHLMKQAEYHQHEQVKIGLQEMMHLFKIPTLTFSFQGDAYFDHVDHWLTQQALGNQTSRASQLTWRDLETLLTLPLFQDYQDYPEMITLLKKIQDLQKGEKHA